MVTKYSSFLVRHLLLSTPLAFYHNNEYIANTYLLHLRKLCHYPNAKQYTKDKYYWSRKKYSDIEWHLYHRKIRKQDKHSYTVKIKYIHSFLLQEKINIDIKHQCSYCDKYEDEVSTYYHFLQCTRTQSLKHGRIIRTSKILNNFHTPLPIISLIVTVLSAYYTGQD